jgi:hypothetical protein
LELKGEVFGVDIDFWNEQPLAWMEKSDSHNFRPLNRVLPGNCHSQDQSVEDLLR